MTCVQAAEDSRGCLAYALVPELLNAAVSSEPTSHARGKLYRSRYIITLDGTEPVHYFIERLCQPPSHRFSTRIQDYAICR